MNYADIKVADIANGEGVRVSLFVSGCRHHCKGCFNAEAWDFGYGCKFDEQAKQKIFEELDKPYIKGLSLLGGEPLEMENQEGLVKFLEEVKEKYPNKDIWCYTGFEYEQLDKQNPITKSLLKNIDVLVDGKFEEEKHKPNLKFRGSTNQRIIDVNETRKCDVIKLIPFQD